MQFNVVDDLLYFDGVEEVYCLQFTNSIDPEVVASSMNYYYEKQLMGIIEQKEQYPPMLADGTLVKVEEPAVKSDEPPLQQKGKNKRALKANKQQSKISKMLLTAVLSEVIHLGEKEFFEMNQRTFVKFYTPQCGRCRAFAPVFEELSEQVPGIVFAELDCDAHEMVCRENEVQSLPALKYYLDGVVLNYDGVRTVQAMREWLDEVGKPLLTHKTAEELAALQATQGAAAYFVLRTANPERYEHAFIQFRGNIAISVEQSAEEALYAVREGVEVPYTGQLKDVASIMRFVAVQSLPFCSVLTPAGFTAVFRPGLPVTLLAADPQNSTASDYITAFAALAKAHHDQLETVYAILDSKTFQSIIEIFGGSADPTIYVMVGDDVYRIPNQLQPAEDSLFAAIQQLHADIRSGTAKKLELRHLATQGDEERAVQLVRVINAIIVAAISIAGILAVWFACRCMRGTGEDIHDETDKKDE